MIKLLSQLVLVLMVVLLIPTGLVLASQGAVAGEPMYPVKRSLENGILIVASVTPWTKAYFDVDRSKRRFSELKTLLARGENAKLTLEDLLSQTNDAAKSIDSVSLGKQKKDLRDELLKQLEEYDKTLLSLQTARQPTPQPEVPKETFTPAPSGAVEVARPSAAATAAPRPAPTRAPAPQPTVSPAPTMPPAHTGGLTAEDIKRIRDELQRIRDEENAKAARDAAAAAKGASPTPSPSPSVSSSASPSPSPTRAPAPALADSGVIVPPKNSAKTHVAGDQKPAQVCTPNQWSNIQCGKCNAAGTGFVSTCEISDISAQKAANPDGFCGCLVKCEMKGFCALESYCRSKNYCSLSDGGADGPDIVAGSDQNYSTVSPTSSPTPSPSASPAQTLVLYNLVAYSSGTATQTVGNGASNILDTSDVAGKTFRLVGNVSGSSGVFLDVSQWDPRTTPPTWKSSHRVGEIFTVTAGNFIQAAVNVPAGGEATWTGMQLYEVK